ncbi:MAG: tRNA threonylcarbamoyladenosine dehydratase [Eubacterium sp.]|nr:tRNA threonylcarbamoyladenosine dehydratase [Eubacterium sp.]
MCWYERTELLLGSGAYETLSSKRVAVFGVGGVGGYTVEALARAGVGTLDLIDSDCVCLSNINRQIIATRKTLGMLKVDAAAERCRDINPDIKVNTYPVFFLPENTEDFDFSKYDYVVDAVDTVSAKIGIAQKAKELGVPAISSMGAGNKLHPELLEVADIYETSVCPLARVMRRELKKRGINSLKVVYSKEPPAETNAPVENGKKIPGSVSFVPSAAGLIIAGEVIKDLLGIN